MTDREKTDLLISCKKRKAADKLSSNLAKPVPSSIKNECLKVYREGKRPEGAMILQQFIKKGQYSDFAAAVEAIDIDRFRPTVRLLKEADFKPEEKHYELLAWLLGPEPVIRTDGEEKKQPARLANLKKIGISLATLSVAAGIIWIISGLTHPQCMYWTGSEYQAVSCTIHAPGRPVYAIDTRRLEHFKKIMKPDTVTDLSVGRVWYFKAGHQLELYTDSGMHPVLTNRKLKPLTLYMQEKYLTKKPVEKSIPDLAITDKKDR